MPSNCAAPAASPSARAAAAARPASTCSAGNKPRAKKPDGGRVMARTYRALAALLSYPTEDVAGSHWRDSRQALAEEDIVPAPDRRRIDALAGRRSASTDIYELQEQYFALFDRSRTLSLHLFEHIHGESRDRGQAMADLITLYAKPRAGYGRRRVAGFPAAVPGIPVVCCRTPRHGRCWPSRPASCAP